jgi:hypothetical protein
MAPDETCDEAVRRWYEHKSILMEASLGQEHDTGMHAIIPLGKMGLSSSGSKTR